MENRAHAFAAGLFTLVLGAALAAVALWFSKDDLQLVPYLMTTSSSVTGVKVEAPVRYRGVDVGKVDEIAIDAASGGACASASACARARPSPPALMPSLATRALPASPTCCWRRWQVRAAEAAMGIAVIRMKPSLMDAGESLFGSIIEMRIRSMSCSMTKTGDTCAAPSPAWRS